MAGYQPRHDTDPVWFNGTQINNLSVTSQQTGVRITAVHGWDDRPDVRDVRELRAGQDGEYADNLYLGGRTITVEGEVYGSTWANLQSRKRTLAATFQPSSDEALFKIPDPSTASPTAVYATTGMTGYERVSCRVIEAIQFGETLDPCCQTFQVILRASDPRIYSDVETSTDSGTTGTSARTATVDQTGTYPTPPTITVTGPTGSSWTVVDNAADGLSLAVSGLTLGSSETMVFDTFARTANWYAAYYRPRTSRSDIVAGWMLNETAGAVADNIQGTSTYDLTINGGVTLNQSGPATGVASMLFNGSTGYLSKAYTAALNPSAMTWEGWVKPSSTELTAVSSVKGVSPSTGYMLTLSQNIVRLTYGTGGSTSSITAAISVSSWVHVAFTLTNGAQAIYINGNLVASGTGTFVVNSTAALNLGRNVDSATGYLSGNLGPQFLFSSVLSAAEVRSLYEASAATSSVSSGYQYLSAAYSRWVTLGTGSTIYTLSSDGLNTGSKLNVTHRDARL